MAQFICVCLPRYLIIYRICEGPHNSDPEKILSCIASHFLNCFDMINGTRFEKESIRVCLLRTYEKYDISSQKLKYKLKSIEVLQLKAIMQKDTWSYIKVLDFPIDAPDRQL